MIGAKDVRVFYDDGGLTRQLEKGAEGTGYKHFTVLPLPGGGLASAHGKYSSIRGPIEIQREVKDHDFLMNVTVPLNTSADVYLPARGWPNMLPSEAIGSAPENSSSPGRRSSWCV